MHRGHVALAEAVRDEAGLDLVVFLPAGRPPHKRERRLAPPQERLRMLELALEGRRGLVIDDRELGREGPSYSHDTMAEIRREHPDDELFFLVGMDSLELLPRWHRIDELARLCTFLVAARPGFDPELLERARRAAPALRLETLTTPTYDVSSSELRERLATGGEVGAMLDEQVLDHILARGLYA